MVSTCKFCDAEIKWKKEYDEELQDTKWVPLDPDTNRRHDCSDDNDKEETYEKSETKIAYCRYCDDEIIWKAIQISKVVNSKTNQIETTTRNYPFDASNPSQRHTCEEQRQTWLVEQESRTGRSEPQHCRNGCGVMVYWDYERRSKNNKPLPYEQANNERHQCKNWRPKGASTTTSAA